MMNFIIFAVVFALIYGQEKPPTDEKKLHIQILSVLDNKPIPGISICLSGTNVCCKTGVDGSCLVKIPRVSLYALIIFGEKLLDSVLITENEERKILFINPPEISIPEVVIEAKGTHHKRWTSSLPTYSIEVNNQSNFLDVIENVSGVSQFKLGKRPGKIIIEGNSFYDASLLVLNTVVENHQWGTEHSSATLFLPYMAVDYMPGASYQVYGVPSYGGALKIIPSIPVKNRKIYGSGFIEATGGGAESFGGGASLITDISKTRILLYGNAENVFEGKTPDNEEIPGYAHYRYSSGSMLEYKIGSINASLFFLASSMKGKIFEEEHGEEHEEKPELFKIEGGHQKEELYLFEQDFSYKKDDLGTDIFFSYHKTRRAEIELIHDSVISQSRLLNAVDATNHVFQAGFDLKIKKFTLPFRFHYLRGINDGEELKILPHREFFFSGGLLYELNAFENRLNLITGISLATKDIHLISDTMQKNGRDYLSPSFSATLTYKIVDSLTAGIRTGYGYRFPTAYELSVRGPHPSDRLYITGLLELEPSTTFSIHPFINYQSSKFHFLVYPFYYNVLKPVALVLMDAIFVEGRDTFYRANFMNAEKRYIYGINLHVDWHILTNLYLGGGVSLIKSIDEVNRRRSPSYFIPQSTFHVEGQYIFSAGKKWESSINLDIYYYLPKKDIAENEKLFWEGGRVPAYLILNSSVSVSYKPSEDATPLFSLKFSGNNILNSRYVVHPSIFERIGVFGPGRSFTITLTVNSF